MPQKLLFKGVVLAVVLSCFGVVALIAKPNIIRNQPALPNADFAKVEGWPWFEDAYFNLKFQYPPNWTVKKVETTNHDDESGQGLMGENAATAGPSRYQTWVIRIVPPYMDTQSIFRGPLEVVISAIVIEQPDHFHGPVSLYSNVVRPEGRYYESVLDPYSDGFQFNYTTHLTFANENASTSVSFGHSVDGTLAGITALKVLQNGYQFQPYLTMTEKLGQTVNNTLVFLSLVNSMQLLDPGKQFNSNNYKIPAN